jgi:hypothetical protein
MPDGKAIRWLVLTVWVIECRVCMGAILRAHAHSLASDDLRARTPTTEGSPYAVSAGVLSRPARAASTCRATDSAGNMQPIKASWHYQAMANNAVQRIPVTVVEHPAGATNRARNPTP